MPIIKFDLDSSGAIKGLRLYENEAKKASRSTNKLTASFSKIKNAVFGVGAVFTTITGSAIALFARKIVIAAGEMEDVQGKFNAVFKGMTQDAEQWSATLSKNFDLSKEASHRYMADIQDIYVPMGMAKRAAAELSVQTVKLAADISAFNGKSMAEVMDNIKSATTGSYEVMKKYGVVLTVNKVKQEAVNLGLAQSVKDVSDAARVQAAYNLILKGSKAALGAHAREQATFNGQMKKAKKIFSDVSTTLGQYLLPMATRAIAAFNQWAGSTQNLNRVLLSTIEGVRFLYNGFQGLKLLLKGLIVVQSQLFKGIIHGLKAFLTPLSFVLDGLKKIRVIDFNPVAEGLKTLTTFADDFAASAVEGFNETVAATEKANAGFDRLKAEVIATGKALEKTGKAGKKMGDDIAEGTAKGISGMSTLERVIASAMSKAAQLGKEYQKSGKQSESAAEGGRRKQVEWNNVAAEGVAEYNRLANSAGNAATAMGAVKVAASGGGSGGSGGSGKMGNSSNVASITVGKKEFPWMLPTDIEAYRAYAKSEMLRLVQDANYVGGPGYYPLGVGGPTQYATKNPFDFVQDQFVKEWGQWKAGIVGAGVYDPLEFLGIDTAEDAYRHSRERSGGVNINVNQKISKSDIPDLARGLEMSREIA